MDQLPIESEYGKRRGRGGGVIVIVSPSRVNNRADMSKGGGKEAKVEAAAIAFSLKHARVKWTLIEKKACLHIFIYSFSSIYYEVMCK